MTRRMHTAHLPPLIGGATASASLGEAFYRIRTALLADGDAAPKTILVASTLPGDGRSTVAANLAIACAGPDRSVLLVDADLRHPVQHVRFGMENVRGLAQVLYCDGDGELHVTQVRPCLDLLASGPLPADPPDLLASQTMARLMDFLRDKYDLVVLDSPPVSAFADAVALAQWVDAVVFVARSSHTHREQAGRALRQLSKSNPRVLGVVLNAVPVSDKAIGIDSPATADVISAAAAPVEQANLPVPTHDPGRAAPAAPS